MLMRDAVALKVAPAFSRDPAIEGRRRRRSRSTQRPKLA